MKLYHITKWFDKDHPDAYDKVNYGFLDDSLFFHRSAIVRGSALLEKDTLEGLWVICEEIPSRKKAGSFEASNVKLFEEASAEEKSAFLAEVSLDDPVFSLLSGNPVVKEIFLQRCQQDPLSHLLNDAFRSNADVQKILMQRLSQAAKDEIDNLFVNRSLSDLSFVLPYKYPVVKDQLRELFLQKCHTAPLSQLWNDDFLSDSEVQEIFVQRLSQADKEEIFKGFAHSSLSDLSSVLPDKYPVVKDQLRELFLQKCHTAPLFLLLDDRYLSDADAQEILVQRLSQATKEETDKLFSNRSLSDLSITLPKKYPILKERLREIFLQRCQQESLSSLLEDAYLSDPDVQEIVLQRYQQIPLHTLVNLPSFSHPVIKKMVLQQCRQMPLSKLLDASYLSHTEIKEIILQKCQQAPLADLLCNDCISDPQIRKIAARRCQQEPLSNLVNALDSANEAGVKFLIEWFLQEPHDSLLSIIRQIHQRELPPFCYNYNYNSPEVITAQILTHRPELLEDAALCAMLSPAHFKLIARNSIVQTEAQLNFFMEHLPAETKAYVVNHHTDRHLVIRNQQAWSLADDNKLAEIVSLIDWQNTQPQYMTAWQPLLARIEADEQIEAAMAIAVSMREKHAAFHPEWWKILNNSVKIRILIYQSNFPQECSDWSAHFDVIATYEESCKNKLLTAVLKFFVNIYAYPTEQKQINFMAGHDALMKYITDCFNTGEDVTHGLNTLLEKCHQGYGSSPYFCDARIWNTTGGIYCPEGHHRPEGGRKKCPYYNDTDLTQTKYRTAEYHNYCDQYLADLILNVGFVPDLTAINVKAVAEYSYRISAFVNRLITIRPHMKCEKCGELFHPNFTYSRMDGNLDAPPKLSATVFYCPQTTYQSGDPKHDDNVYLNYCYHCHQIIDSRECHVRDGGKAAHQMLIRGGCETGQWLCMRCGGTQYVFPGEQCPSCGEIDFEVYSLRKNPNAKKLRKKINYFSCKKCPYDGRNFFSKFEHDISGYVKASATFGNYYNTGFTATGDDAPFEPTYLLDDDELPF